MTDISSPAPKKSWLELIKPIFDAIVPWLVSKPAWMTYAVLITGTAQYFVQGLARENAVAGAELSATLRMAGALDEKSARKVDDVASSAAQKCVEAFKTKKK